MPRLFGRPFTRNELQTYVSDPGQVARVQRATLREGRADGVDTVRVVTGSGFEFSVLPGRALDVAAASYNGIPLFWRAFPGEVNAAFFEPDGMGWMRGYAGGLFLPFRDATNGHETYGAGRYLLDTAKSADLGPGGEPGTIVLDFNFAFQPSCAFDPRWSCPLAPPANRLDLRIEAGERIA